MKRKRPAAPAMAISTEGRKKQQQQQRLHRHGKEEEEEEDEEEEEEEDQLQHQNRGGRVFGESMGGGFMADNKDMMMQLQLQQQPQKKNPPPHPYPHHPFSSPASTTITPTSTAPTSTAAAAHHHHHHHHHRHSSSSSLRKRKIPPPLPDLPSPSPPSKHKKKLLKVILKVPTPHLPNHNPSSPSPSPPASSLHTSSHSPSPSPSSQPLPLLSPLHTQQQLLLQQQHLQHQQLLSKQKQQLEIELDLKLQQQHQQQLKLQQHHPELLQQIKQQQSLFKHPKSYPKRPKLQHQPHLLQNHQQQALQPTTQSPKLQQQQQQTPKLPHHKPSQQIPPQQPKKLPLNPTLDPQTHQNHGLLPGSQTSKTPSLPFPRPHPSPLISAPLSSPPSLAAAASPSILDQGQKSSKKQKIKAVVDSPAADRPPSIAAPVASHQKKQQDSLPPSARLMSTSSAESLVRKPLSEGKVLKDRDVSGFSPKPVLNSPVPTTVPSKKLMEGILDKLQKKDTYGAFSEPVDPKQLPDYYDIIKDPMDFGTMRTRIASGYYTSLEPFQGDIFTICRNAMRYNARDTIYYRQARSIHDAARRILESLKANRFVLEMDDEVEPKQKAGVLSAPRSHKKQPLDKTWFEHTGSDYISGATLASADHGGKTTFSGQSGAACWIAEKQTGNVRSSSFLAGSPSETRADNHEDLSGSFVRSMVLKDGRRTQVFEENRRSTYRPHGASGQGNDSAVTTIGGELPPLVPMGYRLDFPYARSLARFAADLGPAVWKIAAEKIRRVLPPGTPFGPGWVGEQEAPGGTFIAPMTKVQYLQPVVQPNVVKSPTENRMMLTGNAQVNRENLLRGDISAGALSVSSEKAMPVNLNNSACVQIESQGPTNNRFNATGIAQANRENNSKGDTGEVLSKSSSAAMQVNLNTTACLQSEGWTSAPVPSHGNSGGFQRATMLHASQQIERDAMQNSGPVVNFGDSLQSKQNGTSHDNRSVPWGAGNQIDRVPISSQSSSLCSEKHAEKLQEGEVNEPDMSKLGNRCSNTTSGSAVLKHALSAGSSHASWQSRATNSEDGFMLDRNLLSPGVSNHKKSHQNLNASPGAASLNFSPVVPNSRGPSRVQDDLNVRGWVQTQQSDLSQVVGTASVKTPTQLPGNPVQSHSSASVQYLPAQYSQLQDSQARLAMQQQGFQAGFVSHHSNQKFPNVPQFLQQQFSPDLHLFVQQQQMRLHQQSSLKPAAPHPDLRDSNLLRHSHFASQLGGIPQSQNQVWQYMAPQFVSQQGSDLPLSAAPDLNVSLPTTKSHFDQSNATELQQPDLALQL